MTEHQYDLAKKYIEGYKDKNRKRNSRKSDFDEFEFHEYCDEITESVMWLLAQMCKDYEKNNSKNL